MPAGRPSKYDPSMCGEVIALMSEGLSKEATAAALGIAKDTFYRWVKENDEFSDSVKEGESLSLLFWERLGLQGAQGQVQNFNATTWIFNMKNRHGWKDKTEHSGNPDAPIAVTEVVLTPLKRES